MLIIRFITVFLLSVFCCSVSMSAGNDVEIAAVVGGKAISTLDVNNRIKLAASSSGMNADKDTKDKLFHQVLQVLIDESLYEQEAERMGIQASDSDLKNAIAGLEQRNNIKPGTFYSFLKQQGIPADAVLEQLKSQILWGKIVSSRVVPRVVVTDREVSEKMEHISRGVGKSEFDISDIVLPIDSPKDSKKVKALADKLVKKIREGANFSSISKEFSRNTAAESTPAVKWIAEDTMSKEMAAVVKSLKSEEVSEPFISEGAYHIVRLDDRRLLVAGDDEQVSVGIKQAIVPIKKGATTQEKQSIVNLLNDKKKNVKKCDDFTSFAKEINSQVSPQLINTQASSFNPEIKNIIARTKPGAFTDVLVSEQAAYIFMVCSKGEGKPKVVLEMQIREMLMKKKIELQAQRYAANLRRNTFIEIR